jgi:hypothetical protein
MIAPSMESIFLLLSGAILMAGILYWFWSHIQLTQKKVQLLENAVFELRGMVANYKTESPGLAVGSSSGGGSVSVGPTDSMPVAASAPAPVSAPAESAYTDLGDDGWEDDASGEPIREVAYVSTPLDTILTRAEMPSVSSTSGRPGVTSLDEAFAEPELQPGGRIEVPTEEEMAAEEKRVDEFRQIFGRQESGDASSVGAQSVSRTPESLESMPVKELRRLAEQRGIRGASEMRKKEILAALRQQIAAAPATSVTVQRTLDLTEMDETAAEEVEGGAAAEDLEDKEIAVLE